MTAPVAMHDGALGGNEEHASAQTIHGVGKSCSGRRLEVDRLADEDRATQMWPDKAQSPTHFIVDATMLFKAKDTKQRGCRRRFVEDDGCKIPKSLRPNPFLINAGFQPLFT